MRVIGIYAAVMAIGLPFSAMADGHGNHGDTGFYAGISAGWSYLDDVDFKTSKAGATVKSAEFDSGFAGYLQGGYDYGDWRADLEIGYRNFDIDGISNATNETGDVNFYTVMVNGYYDFENSTDFTPYVNLGVGAAIVEGNVSYTGSDGAGPTEDKEFFGVAPAGRIGVGVSYPASDKIDVTGGYSLLAAPTDETGEDDVILLHGLRVGLNFKF